MAAGRDDAQTPTGDFVLAVGVAELGGNDIDATAANSCLKDFDWLDLFDRSVRCRAVRLLSRIDYNRFDSRPRNAAVNA